MAKSPTIAVAILCLTLAACATTPTPEQVAAYRKQAETTCKAKGYKPGTQDFYTCIQLTGMEIQTSEGHKAQAVGTVVSGAATLAPLIFLSDARVKRDIEKVGDLQDGIGLYRFRYLWSDEIHVGVIAQEVELVRPGAVVHGADGYLRVDYSQLEK